MQVSGYDSQCSPSGVEFSIRNGGEYSFPFNDSSDYVYETVSGTAGQFITITASAKYTIDMFTATSASVKGEYTILGNG